PDRLARPAERGAAEPGVDLLYVLRRGGVPPEHVVGVGAQPGDVVAAPGHDPLLGRLREELLDLVGDAAPVLRKPLPQPEHRPHGVADHLVEFLGRRPGFGACLGFGHAPILPAEGSGPAGAPAVPSRARTCETAGRAEATQAGIPTPS